MHDDTCAWCAREFHRTAAHQRFCSTACRHTARNRASGSPANVEARTCARCGTAFTSVRSHQRFCSADCRRWARRGCLGPLPEAGKCERCAVPFEVTRRGKRFCSEKCRVRAEKARSRKRYRKDRDPLPRRECQGCGTRFEPTTDWNLYCSDRCKWRTKSRARYVSTGRPVGPPAKFTRCTVDGCGRKHLARGFCPGHYKAWRRSQGFVDARSGGGSRSAKASARHVARAKRYGVPWERFDPVDVFERDDWTCGLCGDPVDPGLEYPDPMSVSLDHIVPIIQGGGHLLDNCQCSHLTCNLRKARGPRSARIVIAA